MKCHNPKCPARDQEMPPEVENHGDYRWKLCPKCGGAHRLRCIVVAGPVVYAFDRFFRSPPWERSRGHAR